MTIAPVNGSTMSPSITTEPKGSFSLLRVELNLDTIDKLANIVFNSGTGNFQNLDEVKLIMLYGVELGIPPMAAVQTIFVSEKGKIGLLSSIMTSMIETRANVRISTEEKYGGYITNDGAKLAFVRPDGTVENRSEFTMEDARTAGLAGRSVWKAYPRNLCFARAASNAAKWFYSFVFQGYPVYTEEEIREIDNKGNQPPRETYSPQPAATKQPDQAPPDEKPTEEPEQKQAEPEKAGKGQSRRGKPTEKAEKAEEKVEEKKPSGRTLKELISVAGELGKVVEREEVETAQEAICGYFGVSVEVLKEMPAEAKTKAMEDLVSCLEANEMLTITGEVERARTHYFDDPFKLGRYIAAQIEEAVKTAKPSAAPAKQAVAVAAEPKPEAEPTPEAPKAIKFPAGVNLKESIGDIEDAIRATAKKQNMTEPDVVEWLSMVKAFDRGPEEVFFALALMQHSVQAAFKAATYANKTDGVTIAGIAKQVPAKLKTNREEWTDKEVADAVASIISGGK